MPAPGKRVRRMTSNKHKNRDVIAEGEASYRRWKESLKADPENRRIYEEEAAKSDLWLQLVEARQAAGLTQAELAKRLSVTQLQVGRIEKRSYAYTLTTLRKYVKALGDSFSLEVRVVYPRAVADPSHQVTQTQ